MPHVQTITLLAGDRDFLDAIKHVQEVWSKPVTILAFKENISHRFDSLQNTDVILLDHYWSVICQSSKSQQMKAVNELSFKLNNQGNKSNSL